ncbi:hypothetical protein BKD26_11410 [Streptomyces sp. CB03238]|nr:hypothetical protein BKD26_11410 [Streptomyces sp. CB03238]
MVMVGTEKSLEVRLYEAGVRERTGGGAAVQELLQSLTVAEQRRAALWFHEKLCRSGAGRGDEWAVWWLSTRRLGWSAAEADELLRRLVGADALVDPQQLLQQFAPLTLLPLSAAVESGGCDRMLLRAARTASLSAWGDQDEDAANAVIRRRLDALIGPDAEDGTGLPGTLLDDEDGYGPRMRAEHTGMLGGPGVAAFLEHCAGQDKTRATKRWRKRAAELLAGAERGEEVVRALLEGMAEQPEHLVVAPQSWGVRRWAGIASERNERLVRGLLWTAAALRGAWVVPAIGEVALNAGTGTGGSGGWCRNARIATGAVAVLGEFEGAQDEQAVRWLGRLKGRVRNRTVLKGIATSLDAVAARSGLTPSMLAERGVPSLGLDARGMREEELGAYTAVLSVEPSATASLSFRGPQGQVLKSAPKAVREEYGERVAAVREASKRLRALLSAERARLEEHLVAGTRWPGADWERYYADHPVTGPLARALVWEVCADGAAAGTGWVSGVPERAAGGWALAGAEGTAVPLGAGARLRLWHPVRADEDEIREWRAVLGERAARQPFRQVLREVYRGVGVPAGGRVLEYGRVRALMGERGWGGGQLGYFGAGYATEMVRELPRRGDLAAGAEAAWRAVLPLELVDRRDVDGGIASRCVTGALRFERCEGGPRAPWEAAGTGAVPPLVLSEALRDVALFTEVAAAPAQ